jgi:hypothetical protein
MPITVTQTSMHATVASRTAASTPQYRPAQSHACKHPCNAAPLSIPRPSWPFPSGRSSYPGLYSRKHREEQVILCIAKRESVQQCLTIQKTACAVCRPTKSSSTVDTESMSHTDAHSRGIMSAYCAAPGAIAARYLMNLSMDGCSSCRETLSQHS